MKPHDNNWMNVALGLATLCVCVFGGLGYYESRNALQRSMQILRECEARDALKETLSAVTDAETGQRGYLISGDETYLEPFFVGINKTNELTDRLQKFVERGTIGAEEVGNLESLIAAKRAILERTIALRRDESHGGFEEARTEMLINHGRETMNQIRTLIDRLITAQDSRLNDLQIEAADVNATQYSTISFGLAVTLATFAAAATIVNLERSRRNRSLTDLEAEKTKLAAIIDAAMDAVITIDEEQRIVLMNPVAESLFQRTERDARGQPLEILIPPRFRSAHQQHLRHFAEDPCTRKRILDGELIYGVRADGGEFPAVASISKLSFDGRLLFTVILKDVSEREMSRTMIREQAAILNRVRDAVHVRDLDGQIISWNHGAEELYGWSADEAVGRSGTELFAARDTDEADLWSALVKNGVWFGEHHVKTKSGRELVIETRRSFIFDENERPLSQLIIDADVTEQKRAEADKRRSQRLESIGTMASGIAHDVNNVLTPILMGAKLLRRAGDPSLHEELITTITTSAERGADMVKQLLAFAGGATGAQGIVWPKDLLREAQSILSHTLPATITITAEIPDDLWSVLGDATEISQVIMNLAINARDAMSQGGQLSFHAENVELEQDGGRFSRELPAGAYVRISVSDTGCGIEPDRIDKIFDPFFTTKEHGKGTGLGLATSLGIVKGHGGTICVHSEPQHGSTFVIYLPAQRLPATQVTTKPAAEVQSGERLQGDGQTILVVDDEALILQMAQATLEANGYCVLTANRGAQAVALFDDPSVPVDVVLIDMMMPGMDGTETIQALRSIRSTVPVIASSGLRRRQDSDSTVGYAAFLAKPYSEQQLLQTIHRVLHLTSMRTR